MLEKWQGVTQEAALVGLKEKWYRDKGWLLLYMTVSLDAVCSKGQKAIEVYDATVGDGFHVLLSSHPLYCLSFLTLLGSRSAHRRP